MFQRNLNLRRIEGPIPLILNHFVRPHNISINLLRNAEVAVEVSVGWSFADGGFRHGRTSGLRFTENVRA